MDGRRIIRLAGLRVSGGTVFWGMGGVFPFLVVWLVSWLVGGKYDIVCFGAHPGVALFQHS